MKNFLFSFFITFSTLLSFSAYAQRVPVIQDFSSIQLNENGTIMVTPYHSGMNCWGDNCGNKITLKKGEKYSFGDGYHAYGSVTYKGVKDNQLVFEIMSGFNAISFGGGVSEDKKEKIVSPYIEEQFFEGREKEFLEHLEFNEENKEKILKLINKIGITINELLWNERVYPVRIERVKFLVENGADINYTNEKGETILFPAVLKSQYTSNDLQKLMDLSIDIHHKDNQSKEVLDYVNEEIIKCDEEYEDKCSHWYIMESILKGIGDPKKADRENCNKLSHFEFIKDIWGRESCSPKCAKWEFKEHSGLCFSCNYEHERTTTPEACNACPNRIAKKSYEPGYVECERKYFYCPEGTIKAKGWMVGAEEYCASCTSKSGIETTKEECDKCSNRKMVKDKCILKECPEGEFLAYGSMCMPCDHIGFFSSTRKEDCLKCPNRIMYKGKFEYCAPKECPEGTFRSLKFGSCESCSESSDSHVGLDATLEECNKCSERELVGTRCSLKMCPEGRFRINDGTCPSCNWDGDFKTTEEQCSKCLGRVYKNGKCSLR